MIENILAALFLLVVAIGGLVFGEAFERVAELFGGLVFGEAFERVAELFRTAPSGSGLD